MQRGRSANGWAQPKGRVVRGAARGGRVHIEVALVHEQEARRAGDDAAAVGRAGRAVCVGSAAAVLRADLVVRVRRLRNEHLREIGLAVALPRRGRRLRPVAQRRGGSWPRPSAAASILRRRVAKAHVGPEVAGGGARLRRRLARSGERHARRRCDAVQVPRACAVYSECRGATLTRARARALPHTNPQPVPPRMSSNYPKEKKESDVRAPHARR